MSKVNRFLVNLSLASVRSLSEARIKQQITPAFPQHRPDSLQQYIVLNFVFPLWELIRPELSPFLVDWNIRFRNEARIVFLLYFFVQALVEVSALFLYNYFSIG